MTTAAALAARLRALPDDELERLVVARRLPTAALGTSGPLAITDFFDLAEALRTDDAVDAAIERLPRATLLALRDGTTTTPDDTASDPDAVLAPARALGLAADDDAVTARVATHPDLQNLQNLPGGPVPVRGAGSGPADGDDRARATGAEQAFATMSSLAELLRAVRDGAVRELAKGGIGAPLARQLAERSATAFDAVPGRLDLLDRVRFVDTTESPWTTTPAGDDWLLAHWPERWSGLVAEWTAALDPAVHEVLALAGDDWSDLVPVGRWAYPAGARWLDATVLDVAGTAAALGLTVDGRVTSTGRRLLAAHADAADADATRADAVAAASADLPATVDGVYLQHDLTVIAPGPLDPADDDALRSLAVLEAPGLAARYRISEDSVRRALRSGRDHDELLAVLERLGATGVPQPLRYLVDQVAARDGSVVVHEGPDGHGAVVRGTAEQLDLVGVDAELRQFGWDRTDLATITTRYPAHVVATALQDARYPAVLATGARPSAGTGPPGRRRAAARTPETAARAFVERLRLTTTRGDAEPEQEWLGRQIDLAVRGKTPIRLTVRMPDGSEQPFTIVPTSVAAGRVRGRDTSVDVERTLPLSLVVAVDSDA